MIGVHQPRRRTVTALVECSPERRDTSRARSSNSQKLQKPEAFWSFGDDDRDCRRARNGGTGSWRPQRSWDRRQA
jgi:hypothetical protein